MLRKNPKYLVTYEGVAESRGVGMADSGGYPEEQYGVADTLEELGTVIDQVEGKNPVLFGVIEADQNKRWEALRVYKEKKETRRKNRIQNQIADLVQELEEGEA